MASTFKVRARVLRLHLPEGNLPPDRRPGCSAVQQLLEGTLETALHRACKSGDIPAIQRLLDQGVDINALSFRRCTPLFVATYYSQEDAALFLVDQGCDVNLKDERRQTPVMLAIERGLTSLTRVLLKCADCNVDVLNEDGDAIPQMLDITQQDEQRRNILHYVVSARNLEAIGILREKNLIGSLSGQADRSGRFPITLAARKGYLDVMGALLAAGADPNVGAVNAYSVLQEAIMHGRLHIVQLLLSSGANLRNPSGTGDLCLVCACFLNVQRQERPDILQVLIEAGASVNATCADYYHITPLHFAVEMEYFTMARMITLANCDLKSNQSWVDEYTQGQLTPQLEEFFVWLNGFMGEADKPVRLSYQCRNVIRNVVGYKQPISDQINELPVPPKLRNFLLFRDLE